MKQEHYSSILILLDTQAEQNGINKNQIKLLYAFLVIVLITQTKSQLRGQSLTHLKEICHVDIVRKGGRQSDYSYHLLSGLDLSQSTSHKGFYH